MKERLINLNEEITLIEGGEEIKGTVNGIDDMCRLKIRLTDGEERLLGSAF